MPSIATPFLLPATVRTYEDMSLIPEEDRHQNNCKKRTRQTLPWRDWGRQYARLIDTFTLPIDLVNTFLRAQLPRMEDYRNTHLHVLKSYELLATHIPDFNELIQETNPEKTHALTDELKRGQDNAFQSDMNRLKIAIIEMIAQTYPETQVRNTLSPHEKKMRGFVDEVTGHLLCPIGLDWSDKSTKTTLRDNPDLANERAYKAIFTGPSSWDSVSGETHMYKKCNARLANMHEVTTCSIAYIAVQVCAALSLVEHNFKFSAVFDLLKFYWNIVEYLDEPDAEDEVRDLLDWWNFQIFPDCKKTTTVFQSQEMDSLALLKAQRAAKRRVRADAESELEI